MEDLIGSECPLSKAAVGVVTRRVLSGKNKVLGQVLRPLRDASNVISVMTKFSVVPD